MQEHAAGTGFCAKHGRVCTPADDTGAPSVDVLVAGPPCQPFSLQRSGFKSSGRTDHPLLSATLGGDEDSLISVARAWRPGVLIVENVQNFVKSDPVNKLIPMRIFLDKLATIRNEHGQPLYTGLHVFMLSPDLWFNMLRTRTLRALPCARIARGALVSWLRLSRIHSPWTHCVQGMCGAGGGGLG